MLDPSYFEWSYVGVNSTIPGNGGPECAYFIPTQRKILETLFCCGVSLIYFIGGYYCMTMPTPIKYSLSRCERQGKQRLLVLVSIIFGMEVGFKISSRQFIYLLNPCHVMTMIQIYLLSSLPSHFSTFIFRAHIHLLNGPVLALIFPVTNTRILPFETQSYWIQHSLLLVTPYYLLRIGGVYTIEKIHDFSWAFFTLGANLLYHFLILQPVGYYTQVNLNNMLCPAISDPFYGPNYRLAGFFHQTLCVPLVSKSFCLIATFMLTKYAPTKVKLDLHSELRNFSAGKNGISHSRNGSSTHIQ